MKKVLLYLTIFCNLVIPAKSEELLNIPYENIKENGKIKLVEDSWSDKVNQRKDDYFIKLISDGTGSYSEYYYSEGNFAFTTPSQYDFIYRGDLIGYANQDLKFYNYTYVDGNLSTQELSAADIQEMFPDFTIIKISDFSPFTNSLKIKKGKRNLKIILLNDTDRNFYHYSFTSDNAKFEKYLLTGFLNIKKKGMIQFSHFGENTKESPWFILLIR